MSKVELLSLDYSVRLGFMKPNWRSNVLLL